MKTDDYQRGMKKWQPFNALENQNSYIAKAIYEANKSPKPVLSEDEISLINQVLANYNHNKIKLKYYNNGYIKEAIGYISKIDKNNKRITFERTNIYFTNILEINIF